MGLLILNEEQNPYLLPLSLCYFHSFEIREIVYTLKLGAKLAGRVRSKLWTIREFFSLDTI